MIIKLNWKNLIKKNFIKNFISNKKLHLDLYLLTNNYLIDII